MAVLWTAELDDSDREQINANVTAYGPLPLSEADPLGWYYGLKADTVQRYFSPASGNGLIRVSHVGLRISNLPDEEARRRIVTGACLGSPGGMYREPLYTGKAYTYQQDTETLAEAVRWVSELIDGEFDKSMGFRFSRAWTFIRIDGEEGAWVAIVLYNGMDPDDDSDPYEEGNEETGEE